ncbi:MAG: hypothetical protein HY006_03745 [Candidatus Sungbacteria bacterium]|nr:hypothetical protein [Candidatus Sungbacteria bacterium]
MTQESVVNKAMRIAEEGKAAFVNGTFGTFEKFPESLRNRFTVALRFDAHSEWECGGNIVDRLLLSLELNTEGWKLFLAQRDFLLHVTLLEGMYEGSDAAERYRIFRELNTNISIAEVAENIRGMVIPFKLLIPDKGGNILLLADEIPDLILEAREQLATTYAKYGLRPLLIEDLLHATVARVMNLPTDAGTQVLDKLAQISRAFAHEPLTLRVSHVVAMNSYDFLT